MTSVLVARAGRRILGQRSIVGGVSASVLFLVTASAGAQWSVTFLNPNDTYSVVGYGIAGGMQVGEYLRQGNAGAALWRGSAASFVDLHPIGKLVTTTAVATDGLQQVGCRDAAGIQQFVAPSGKCQVRTDGFSHRQPDFRSFGRLARVERPSLGAGTGGF